MKPPSGANQNRVRPNYLASEEKHSMLTQGALDRRYFFLSVFRGRLLEVVVGAVNIGNGRVSE